MKSKDGDKLGITSWMVIGLIAYLAVSVIVIVAFMLHDSASASELAVQSVAATVVQATLAAAALFGVSIAVLYVAKNTDRNTERQASAHELAAETASLDRIEKYLLEVVTPLWKVKNAIDELFVYAKTQSEKLDGYYKLDYEDARILHETMKIDISGSGFNPEEVDKEYNDLLCLQSVISSNKDVCIGIDRTKLIDAGYKEYIKDPKGFFQNIKILQGKNKLNDAAIGIHYKWAELSCEDEKLISNKVDSGLLEKESLAGSDKEDSVEYVYQIIIAWYYNKVVCNTDKKILNFMWDMQASKEMLQIIDPEKYSYLYDYENGPDLGENVKDVPIETVKSCDTQILWMDPKDTPPDPIELKNDRIKFNRAKEGGFKGEWKEWYNLKELDKINAIAAKVYCRKTIGVEIEKYLGAIKAEIGNLYQSIEESIKLLNDTVISVSYVIANLKMLYAENNNGVLHHSAVAICFSQVKKAQDIVDGKEVFDVLSDIKLGALVDLGENEFLILVCGLINIIPYVVLKIIEPLERINKKIFSNESDPQKKTSPLVDALKFNVSSMPKNDDSKKMVDNGDVEKIADLKALRKVIDESIFCMSTEFWDLAQVRKEKVLTSSNKN